jgi:hypothetical protein
MNSDLHYSAEPQQADRGRLLRARPAARRDGGLQQHHLGGGGVAGGRRATLGLTCVGLGACILCVACSTWRVC